MKFKLILNIITVCVVIYFMASEFGVGNPLVGQELGSIEVTDLKTQEQFRFPDGKPSVVLFWASWCTPCKLEMKRLESSSVPTDRIIALNPFETKEQIARFINDKENAYRFRFIDDKNLFGKELNIRGTPTVIHLFENKTVWAKTGISVWGIWKAESLFNSSSVDR